MLTLNHNGLLYQGRYHPGLVADLKARIPATERQWDGQRKAWLVALQHGPMVAALHEQYFGERLTVPQAAAAAKPELRAVELRYLGVTKDRGAAVRSAFGWADDAWTLIFPEPVLRAWFAAPSRPDEEPTLYQTLSSGRTATADELKSAYRRLARQWHPDVCREPDAKSVFQAIQHAFSLLSDPDSRARYDAGLQLVASLGQQAYVGRSEPMISSGYRAPLRCGLLLVLGVAQLNRFLVSEIQAWEDIVDGAGRTLTVSWPVGADHFVETWL